MNENMSAVYEKSKSDLFYQPRKVSMSSYSRSIPAGQNLPTAYRQWSVSLDVQAAVNIYKTGTNYEMLFAWSGSVVFCGT